MFARPVLSLLMSLFIPAAAMAMPPSTAFPASRPASAPGASQAPKPRPKAHALAPRVVAKSRVPVR
jgi:hypothetical protein